MELREEKREPPRSLYFWLRLALYICALAALVEPFAIQYTHGIDHDSAWSKWVPIARLGFGVFAMIVLRATLPNTDATDESQARQRVRQAEDKLGDQLRRNFEIHVCRDIPTTGVDATVEIRDEDPAASHNLPTVAAAVEQLAIERRDDRLTLAALWDVTHGRMELYHEIVTGQARRSFGAAQVAMGVGFFLLVVFAVLAAEAKTTTAAISAGGLGAVGAAFAAYIGKTFIRPRSRLPPTCGRTLTSP